ncbi:anti-sigma factor [uncultured Algibacter sp.]|uniref:anti-sigma factor n=1 Tax=uncultured Algibacter sp. TaxID=298659 RepID=UPI003217A07F
MKKRITVLYLIVLNILIVSSCSNDDDNDSQSSDMIPLTLELENLGELTNGANYEGWIIVDNVPVSTGKFTDNALNQTFMVNKANLEKATEFLVSIEPRDDSDAGPSTTKILGGMFDNDAALLTTNKVASDFSNISGKFVIATPTDNNGSNEEFGVWFMDPTGFAGLAPSLNLPVLSEGWKYEGWVVLNDKSVSTGTFTMIDASDDAALYSDTAVAPPNYPGEDFLSSAPRGLIFPADGEVVKKQVFITIEPNPDYDQATPFSLMLLNVNAGPSVSPVLNTMEPVNKIPSGKALR